jgi:hypothetical protein
MLKLVERYGDIKISYNGTRVGKEIHFECPFCCTKSSFMVYSPSHCSVCQNQLPEFSKLMNTLIGRIMWHFEEDVDDMMIII